MHTSEKGSCADDDVFELARCLRYIYRWMNDMSATLIVRYTVEMEAYAKRVTRGHYLDEG